MKLKRFLTAVFVLGLAAVLTGCLGGGTGITDEDAVHSLLNQYEQAFRTKDAKKLADLYTYPIEIDGASFENAEEAAFYYTLSFEFLTEVHEFELFDRTLMITGSEATAEVTAKSKITLLGETLEDNVPGILMLRKVESQWRIAGHVGIE